MSKEAPAFTPTIFSRDPEVTIPVPVRILNVPAKEAKEAFDFFMAAWQAGGKRPFNGEYDMPNPGPDQRRAMTTDYSQISHVITDIYPETFDKDKNTVMMKVRFAGPKRNAAIDDYVKGSVRLACRTVRGKDVKTKKPVTRIVTWDLVHAPDPGLEDKLKQNPDLK